MHPDFHQPITLFNDRSVSYSLTDIDCGGGFQVNLQSEEYGKHLMGVEDLLQKHSIIESDIAIVGTRVEAINAQAQTFVDSDFPDVEGSIANSCRFYKRCLSAWFNSNNYNTTKTVCDNLNVFTVCQFNKYLI